MLCHSGISRKLDRRLTNLRVDIYLSVTVIAGKLELIQLGVVGSVEGDNAGQGFALGVGYGEVQCVSEVKYEDPACRG